MKNSDVRQRLQQLIDERKTDMSTVSKSIGKNHSYLFQYFTKGTPRSFNEDVRKELGNLFGIEPDYFKEGSSAKLLSKETASGSVEIAEIDVRAAAGTGLLVENDGNEVLGAWSFPHHIFGRKSINPQNLRIIQAKGDSGVPEIHNNDYVMIDISDRLPSPPGFFAVWDGIGLVLKKVEFIPNSDPPRIRLISPNKQYKDYELQLDECEINGRMIGKWSWT